MEVVFSSPKNIIVQQEQSVTIDKLTIIQMIDIPEKKVVRVQTVELGGILLWSGAEYDAIGQWTDTDVENRIKAMYP